MNEIGLIIFAISLIATCLIAAYMPNIENIDRNLRIRFEKRMVKKHKNGDMSGVAKNYIGNYVYPGDVVGKDISPQDVLDTNLDILTFTLLYQNRPLTWEEKVKELSENKEARYAILNNEYYTYHHKASVPDELLRTMIENNALLRKIMDKTCPSRCIIYPMAKNGNEHAKQILALTEEKEARTC